MKKTKPLTRIELLRRGKEISQEALADAIGVAPCMIAHIEGRDRRTYPKLKRALASALRVTEEEIFDSENFAKIVRRR